MHAFLQRIEREQAGGTGDGLLRLAGLLVVRQQPGHDRQRHAAQTLAFDRQPVVERRRGGMKALQQVTPVQRRGALQRRGRGFPGTLLELAHVDLDLA
ncbi:hypothetical protein D3C87_1763750 [compost metagenome]